MIGPWAAGLIFDNYDPNYVWYIGGVLCVFAILAFFLLHLRLGSKQKFQPAKAEEVYKVVRSLRAQISTVTWICLLFLSPVNGNRPKHQALKIDIFEASLCHT